MTKPKKISEVHNICRQSRVWLMGFRMEVNKMIDEKLNGIDVIEYVATKQNGATSVNGMTDDGVKHGV